MDAAEVRSRLEVTLRTQQGAALLITLVLIGILGALAVVWIASSGATEARRVQDTARAMGMIRDALIARAASDLNRPGSLPCPDFSGTGLNVVDDGVADMLSGTSCPSNVGRVPWRTLDLPDLRDKDGNRFWYALSPVYTDSPGAGTLNSDTAGQLIVTGAQPATDVVAIIFAPGAPVPGQDRVASANAVASWLEGANTDGDLTFDTGAPSATFNDQLLVITRDMLMPSVEQRVARQARKCLERFAASASQHYPFAAAMSDLTYADGIQVSAGPPPIYTTSNYGRIPLTLAATNAALGTITSWPSDDPQPSASATDCFQTGTWWDNWRELLLYRVAAAYAPGLPPGGPCGTTCLTVNGATDAKFVVVVAGRMLRDSLHPAETPDQSARISDVTRSDANNYLEEELNEFPGTGVFGRRSRAVTTGPLGRFNDRVECASESGAPPCN